MIVILRGEKYQVDYEDADPATLTPLQKAISLALRLRDFKEDFPAALKVIDMAIAKMSDKETEKDKVKAADIRHSIADLME